jgi:hypothetical protein
VDASDTPRSHLENGAAERAISAREQAIAPTRLLCSARAVRLTIVRPLADERLSRDSVETLTLNCPDRVFYDLAAVRTWKGTCKIQTATKAKRGNDRLVWLSSTRNRREVF